MKTLQFVLFVVSIVSATCMENFDRISSDFKHGDFALNQEQSSLNNPQEDFNEKLKNYFPSEPKQYLIIKRTHDVPYSKKYSIGQSSEQIKHPSKYSYKSKPMPVRVVQQGSVKHIYLDMPDLFDETLPTYKSKPLQIPNTYDNVKQTGAFNNLQFNNFNPIKYEQKYQEPVQYSYSPQNQNANLGFSQGDIQHGFNTVSTGYKVDNAHNVNALLEPLQQQFSHNQPAQYAPQYFGNNEYSSGTSQNQFDTSFKNEYSNPNLPQFNTESKNEFSQSQFPQYSADGTEKYTYEIPEQYKSLFTNNNAFGQTEEFKPSVGYQQEDTNARISSVSGFDPNLVNIMNDVLNKGQEYSTPDVFKI